jgi:hypothetical protein
MLIFFIVVIAAIITICAPFAWWINLLAAVAIIALVVLLIKHFDIALTLIWAAIKWVALGAFLWLIIHFLP